MGRFPSQIVRVLVIILLIAGLSFILSKYSPAQKDQEVKNQQQKTAVSSYKDHPEMKDILNPADQTKRLKAARKFVERVGVEDALEILEHSPLPHTGEGHLVVHL